jgi:chromosome segregation ATPase
MKQPNDTKTADVFEGEKRGRGRPKLDNAKSAAERARQYRLNKKSRPQVIRPLAPAADEISFLRGQVDALSRDLHNAEIRARFAEDLFDEQLAEISRLRSELDDRDASREFPLEARQRISSLESKVKGLNQLLDEAEQQVNKYTRLADIAQEEVHQLKRAALPKLIVPGAKKAVVVKSDASRKTSSKAVADSSPVDYCIKLLGL